MSEPSAALPRIEGRTTTVGVIGWPVAHSLSPAIHNAAFEALGLPWVYVPLPVQPGRVAAAVAGLRALGFAGANVTMPHKTEVAGVVDDLSDDARRLRAVNTIVVGPEATSGHNTDAPGFERFLRQDAGFDPAGGTALLFGAGGAARACALALGRAGAARISVAARDPARADLAPTLEGLGVELVLVPFERAREVRADLVVNATPLGILAESLPTPAFGPEVVVVDLLYRPPTTPLLTAAREAGARAFGGLGLLLHQAALSFELWTGQPAPLDVMSAAALAALSAPVVETAGPAMPEGPSTSS
jgi:shikimate dehydrogenase